MISEQKTTTLMMMWWPMFGSGCSPCLENLTIFMIDYCGTDSNHTWRWLLVSVQTCRMNLLESNSNVKQHPSYSESDNDILWRYSMYQNEWHINSFFKFSCLRNSRVRIHSMFASNSQNESQFSLARLQVNTTIKNLYTYLRFEHIHSRWGSLRSILFSFCSSVLLFPSYTNVVFEVARFPFF